MKLPRTRSPCRSRIAMLEVVDGHHLSRPRGVDALTAMQDQGKRERGTVAWRQESGAALDSTAAAAYALAD